MSAPVGTKFGRAAALSVEVAADSSGNPQNITLPKNISIEFEITRGALSSSQSATFRISNLSKATRGLIFKDRFNWSSFRALQFRAGYGNFTPLIFNGTVLQAYTEHPTGGTEDITQIDGIDGGFAMTNGYWSGWGSPQGSVPPGTSSADILKTLALSLPGVTGQPIIGSFPVANMRGEVLFGNTWGLIQRKSQGQAIIDSGQVKILNQNEALTPVGPIPVFDASTGLLGSPRRSGAMLEWDILFEPRLTIGQLVQVVSTVNPNYNGIYKVMGFRHRGIVPASAQDGTTPVQAVDGPYQTTISVYAGFGPLNGSTNSPFTPVAGTSVQ